MFASVFHVGRDNEKSVAVAEGGTDSLRFVGVKLSHMCVCVRERCVIKRRYIDMYALNRREGEREGMCV